LPGKIAVQQKSTIHNQAIEHQHSHMRTSLFVLMLFALMQKAQSQELNLNAGTQFPLQYTAGMELKFHEKWAMQGHAGVLTQPYDQLILGLLERLGTDEFYINITEQAFQFGLVGEAGFSYFFNARNYIGVFGQYIDLTGADAPLDLIRSQYSASVPLTMLAEMLTSNNELQLQSSLLQAGVSYGRIFPLSSPHFSLRTEIALSKHLTSSSTVSFEGATLTRLSETIDQDLGAAYKKYAYIPTLNLYFTWQIFASEKESGRQ